MWLLAVLAVLGGCGDKDEASPLGEADGDADTDTDWDADSDADSDSDTDIDADTDSDDDLDVHDVNGLPFRRIVGTEEVGHVGYHVRSGGDLDGDGLADVVQRPGSVSNRLYAHFGPVAGDVPIDDADVEIYFAGSTDNLWLPDQQKDLDGDGRGDLLTARYHLGLYVLAGPLSGSYGVEDALHFDLGAFPTWQVALGNFDNDDWPDLLLGNLEDDEAGCYDPDYQECAGAAALLLGPLTAYADLEEVPLHAKWLGEHKWAQTGRLVDNAGDTDGDGIDDLMVLAPFGPDAEGEGYLGTVYIISGPGDAGTQDISVADARIDSGELVTEYQQAGLGDLDGDGYGEVGFGFVNHNPEGYGNGAVELFFGPLAEVESMDAPDAKLVGPGERLGYDLAGLGDLDGDGGSELLIGGGAQPNATSSKIGAVVSFSPFSGTVDLARQAVGLYDGSERNSFGMGVASPGDMDGNGSPDLLVEAGNWGSAGTDVVPGAVFLLDGADIPLP